MRTRANIVVRDQQGFEVGVISIDGQAFQHLVTGRGTVKLEPEAVRTLGGKPFSPEVAGFKPTGRQVFIEISCEVDVFGGPNRKWLFTTNAFGATYIERMIQAEDAELFNLWIEQASTHPSRVAKFLAACTKPDDYRTALVSLRKSITQGGNEKTVGGRA